MKGRPIVLSLTLLVLTTSAFAWAASFALVVALPKTAEKQVSMADIAAVLQGSARAADHDVELSVEPQSPIPRSKSALQTKIVAALGKAIESPDEVRIDFRGFVLKGETNKLPSVDSSLSDLSLSLARVTAAVRRKDGSWLVLRQDPPLLTIWHLQIIAAFCIFALLLIPIAWIVARRLSAPMLNLSLWLEQAEMDGNGTSPPEGGPRELRQVAAAIAEMSLRLRLQVEERTTMLAAVAHDLRTPLTALRVRSDAAPLTVRGPMIEDISRLEQMISQFLLYVRGASAGSTFVDLDLAELVARSIPEPGRVRVSAHPPLPIRGNPLDLRRMLTNLIENAIRFGGGAEIVLAEEEGFATLTVRDEGPGLADEELERVFQPFYRTDQSRNSDTGGTGLGLAIVQAVVQAHAGQVRLRNLELGGLEALVRLPLSKRC
jgi:signal transduction histidine kinase